MRRWVSSLATSIIFQTSADNDFLRIIASGMVAAQKITIEIADKWMLVKGILPMKKKKNSWSTVNGAINIAPDITIK